MRVLYLNIDGTVQAIVGPNTAGSLDYGVFDWASPDPTFSIQEAILWKFDGATVVKKTGQELIDAQAAFDATVGGKMKKAKADYKNVWKQKLKDGSLSKKEQEDLLLALCDAVFVEEA